MGLLLRHRWFAAAAGITLIFAVVSLTAHKSPGLTAFADLLVLALMLAAGGVTLASAFTRPRHERVFWALMTLGFALWASNQAGWAYREIVLRQPVQDPFFFDIILFFHTLPLIAAFAWRPDLAKEPGQLKLSVLNFLMLLGWWVFLYAFIVFPHQYVLLNVPTFSLYYDRLYGLESALLLGVLGLGAWTSSAGWRRFYLHFFAAGLIYGSNSQLLDWAVAGHTYYSGSLYDILLIATVAWMAAVCLSARQWDLRTGPPPVRAPWRKIVAQLATLAILSLPALGLWALLFDRSVPASRMFRLITVLIAMVALGALVFLRQYRQDRALIDLLQESRRSYDRQKRLQKQLVQKEKLASLGTLVAGAAHEIDHPLTAIMLYSDQLWAQGQLTDEQNTILRKIVNQAQRTHDLVANLLSFARQSPGAKVPVDLILLLNRATQMLEPHYSSGKIRVSLSAAPDFPRVHGNAKQLFQVCVEIIENAMDALHEAGGGSLHITARKQGGEAVVQFSDTGPGIREPERVFDPFYTTKPVGKGTGLGLSVVYGIIQDHGGQIACHNQPEGGAFFVVRFPAAAEPAAQGAGAAGD